jgi:hypothetical protein
MTRISSGFAAFRAERLCLSARTFIFWRLRLILETTEAQPREDERPNGKAEPFRTEGGKAAPPASAVSCQAKMLSATTSHD